MRRMLNSQRRFIPHGDGFDLANKTKGPVVVLFRIEQGDRDDQTAAIFRVRSLVNGTECDAFADELE